MGAPMKSAFSGVAELLNTGKSLHRAAIATYGKPVEEAMRMGISFMPVDDAANVDWQGQIAYTAVDLFSLYRRVVTQLPHRDANFTWHRHITNALKAIRCFQACAEMIVSRRRGQHSREVLTLCMRIEMAKVVLRCILYGLRMEINCGNEELAPETDNPKVHQGSRTGRQIKSLTSLPEDFTRVPEPSRSLAYPEILWGEILYNLRPLFYLYAMRKWGRRSWPAWFLAIIVDHLSLVLLEAKAECLAPNERQEVDRRRFGQYYALLRSPFFDRFVQGSVVKLDGVIKKIPILNVFNLLDIWLALQPLYFSTSGT